MEDNSQTDEEVSSQTYTSDSQVSFTYELDDSEDPDVRSRDGFNLRSRRNSTNNQNARNTVESPESEVSNSFSEGFSGSYGSDDNSFISNGSVSASGETSNPSTPSNRLYPHIGENVEVFDDLVYVENMDGENSEDNVNDATSSTIVNPGNNSVSDTTAVPTAIETLASPVEEAAGEEPPSKVRKVDLDQTDNGSVTCPICFDPWTNAGEHRLISLKCGHLFGHSCILRWLRQKQNRLCPTCKTKSIIKDIRFIYPPLISYVDNSETEAVKAELEQVKMEKTRNDIQLRRLILNEEINLKRIKELESIIDELKNPLQRKAHSNAQPWSLAMQANVEVMKENGCRVFAYNKINNTVSISQMTLNCLFSGYGIKWMRCDTFTLSKLMFLHQKEIRGLSYSDSNNLLMSVSLDKNIKLLDCNNEKECTTIETDSALWSCCWDREQPHRFYAGAVGGVVLQYDIRQTRSCISKISSNSDLSPVISVASLPGGIVTCQLNSLRACRKQGGSFHSSVLSLEGPFSNLNYEPLSEQLVVSTRPNSQSPHCKHIACNIDLLNDKLGACNIVHTFKGSRTATIMSRTCQFTVGGEHLFAAHNEDSQMVDIWSISRQNKKTAIQCSGAIVDTLPWTYCDENYLGILSQNRVKVYKVTHEL